MTSLDPAVVFAVFTAEFDGATPFEMSRWRKETEQQTAEIYRRIVETGVLSSDTVEAAEDLRSRFVLLRAIDRAFSRLDPYGGAADHGRLGPYLSTLHELGRYNREGVEHGEVIPRRTFPTRPVVAPEHVQGHLENLLLVRNRHPSVHLNRVGAEFEFDEEPAETVRIGCVPFITSLEEMAVRRVDDAARWYSIKPDTAGAVRERDWRARIANVLAALDESEAQIGVLPELALDDQMLRWWRQALRETPRPQDSRLHWVLVGSGPLTVDAYAPQQPNRAMLLDRRTGRTVLEQDKCASFTLTWDQIHAWGLDPHLRPEDDDVDLGQGLAEWMHRGWDRHALDCRVGRMTILICEDLGRPLDVGEKVAAIGPSHLLVPIFAPPILRYRWQEIGAFQMITEIGSTTVITTSCAISLPEHELELDPDPATVGTAMVVQPLRDGPRHTWSNRVDLLDANGQADAVLLFDIPRC